MIWAKIKGEIADKLQAIVGNALVLTEREAILDYLVDETPLSVRPSPVEDVVVVKPATVQETADVMKLANECRIPVYPRGGGTGLAGGCIPTRSGIVLSLERLNRVIEVDKENLMVVVEAGVKLEDLFKVADNADLLFPPHPGDEAAQVGGLVVCNAGGARAIRYGIMRNYVKGMEVVLPTGEILNLGGKLLKDVAGYDLMHLIIGSHGTLGVVTKVTLRLYPKFRESATLILPFQNRHQAIEVVPRILQEGILPSAIEYIDGDLMEQSAKQLGKEWPVGKSKALLIIIVTGSSKDEVYLSAEKIDRIAKEYNAVDTFVVENWRKQSDILKIRSNIYFILKPSTLDFLDVTVPPANIAKLLDIVDEVARKYNVEIPVVGHAGDGNLHPAILMKTRGEIEKGDLEKLKTEIYDATVSLGGTITGEHGIGKIRVSNLVQYADKKAVDLMKRIKRAFDPNNILNPENIVNLKR